MPDLFRGKVEQPLDIVVGLDNPAAATSACVVDAQ